MTEVHVIPILLRPTPAWETTALGSLQALPTQAKPVTTWRARDKAFANIADGINHIIQHVQWEEKHPVQEYGLAFDYYTLIELEQHEETLEIERTMQEKAEQWLVAIQGTGGILQEIDQETRWDDQLFTWKKWLFTLQQQQCHIHIRSSKKIHPGGRYYDPVYLRATTSHVALLDHFVKMGRLPYKTLQWTLSHDLDLGALQTQIYEQTGKRPNSPSAGYVNGSIAIEYRIYDNPNHYGVKASLSSQRPGSPTRIRLTHDTPLDGSFYRAHELFSVRTVLSILRGELSYKRVAELVEDASCSPEEMDEEM